MTEIKMNEIFGGMFGLGVILMSYLFASPDYFPAFLGLGIILGAIPFLLRIMKENRISSEKEDMFLEFTRNLVESVKTGTPISKSIVNVKDKDFGALSPHILKLANQISMGIPLNQALIYFSRDVQNKSISRSLTLIGQAERAGGDIGEILESVSGAVNTSDKLKKERKAAISTLISQGYIIFLIFIIIILILQFQILPMVSGLGDVTGSLGFGSEGYSQEEIDQSTISNSFLYLILVQGFFAGFVVGKLAEGNIKAGVKHSFAMMFLSFIASTLANIFLG